MSLRDSFDTNATSRAREFSIEDYLKERVKYYGGKCYKLTSPGYAGMPDRLILYNGVAVFVEVKRPGAKPRALQEKRMDEIRQHGCLAFWVSTREEVDRLMTRLVLNG